MSFLGKLFGGIVHLFTGTFAKVIPTLIASAQAELATVEAALITFAKTDLGKLAIDAVNEASTLVGATDDAKRAAAKAQFIADAKLAGHDLAGIGQGICDWCIQTAYTVIAGVVAQTPPTP